MQDRFKYKYVFTKDFGGKTGICYKMPIFDLDTITDENFNKVIKEYADYGYTLVSKRQCTGLKDKHGKFIFEGDIVSVKVEIQDFFGDDEYYSETYKGKIIYDKGEIVIDVVDTTKHTISLYRHAKNCEIIGNIYESQELLKEVNNEEKRIRKSTTFD